MQIADVVSSTTDKIGKTKPRINRWGDWQAALLLFALLAAAGSRLTATHWTEDLGIIQTVAFLGCLAGLALGQSIFSKRLTGLFAFLYGSFVVPWQLGLTLNGINDWKERLWSMAGRLQIILEDIFRQRAVEDNLFFLFLMAALFWSLAVWAGYSMARYGEPWRVVLPAGLTMFVIDLFDPLLFRRSWYLAIYIFLALLIVARMAFLQRRKGWQQRRAYIPSDIGFDVSRFSVLLALLIVLVAWNLISFNRTLPGISDVYNVIREPYLGLKDKSSFLFAALRASLTQVVDFYGNFQTLGLGAPKSDQVIMTVEAPANPYPGARFYWRAHSYDIYQNGQWNTGIYLTEATNPATGDLPVGGLFGRTEAEFVFRPLTAIVSVFVASQPVWFSRTGVMQYESHSDGTVDVVNIKANPYIHPGERYYVRSFLSSFTQKQLREAGTTYPYWVLQRYLQLPEDLTPRTRELALQITEGKKTPYDKAQAITDWLRTNINYQEVIDSPPLRQDAIDWFLFDYRKGFCNYYATAEVLLLRSLGIPARWVVGYAQGTRQSIVQPTSAASQAVSEKASPDTVLFSVTEKDAHAWPEVYFPGYGWVEFEPTASQLAINRQSGEEAAASSTENGLLPKRNFPQEEPGVTPLPTSRPNLPAPEAGISLGTVISIVSLVAALVIIGIVLLSRRSPAILASLWVRFAGEDARLVQDWQEEGISIWEQFERGLALLGKRAGEKLSQAGIPLPGFIERWFTQKLLPVAAQAYQEMNNTLRWLGKRPLVSDTPAERARAVIQLIPEASQPVESLLAEYQNASFSQKIPDLRAARLSARQLRMLTRRKWIGKFFQLKDNLKG